MNTNPGKNEAESYSAMNGVTTQAKDDTGGDLNVGGMHFLSAIASLWSHLEYSLDRASCFEGLLCDPPVVRDGLLRAPHGPGCGLVFDPARLARMERPPSPS